MSCHEPVVWTTCYDTWNPLVEDSIDTQMDENWGSPEGHWSHLQYARREMSNIPMENTSNNQYACSVYNKLPTYNVYGTSASYSTSPPSHPITSATPSIAIPRILPQTRISSAQISPTTYHRSNSSVSCDTSSFSPLESTSPFSHSLTESTPMSRSSTTNMPVVQGHGLSSFDEHTLKCYCGSEFKGAKLKNIRSNFKRHLKTKGTQIPCPQCDKVFNRQDNVQQHIRTRHTQR